MSSTRAGYGFALAAAVLVLVGSMAAVAAGLATAARIDGTRAWSGRDGGGMMTGSGPAGTQRPACAAPTDLPGTTIQVRLADMGMSRMMGGTAPLGIPMRMRTSTGSAPSGQVSLVVANLGSRTHELVILPLAGGQEAGTRSPGPDGTVDEAGSLGEASASCAAGAGQGIAPGSVGWVTVTLPAGRYELVCNEPNHYADGMWQELDIT